MILKIVSGIAGVFILGTITMSTVNVAVGNYYQTVYDELEDCLLDEDSTIAKIKSELEEGSESDNEFAATISKKAYEIVDGVKALTDDLLLKKDLKILNKKDLNSFTRKQFTIKEFKKKMKNGNGEYSFIKIIASPFNTLGACLGGAINFVINSK